MRRDDLVHHVVDQLKRLPEPYSNHYGVVPLPPPRDVIGLGERIISHEPALAALSEVDTLAGELDDPYLISRILIRREAVSSSSIEGTNSTLDELLSAEETSEGQASEATRQVRDYALTLDEWLPRAMERGTDIFDLELIQNLHRAVMKEKGGYEDIPGEIRRVVVWIGGGGNIAYSTYNPTPPEDIGPCLEQSLAYMREQDMHLMTQSLITRMAVAHAHFEAVHPFRDGNGRVGRLLLPLMMAAAGHTPLYLSPYIEAHKEKYYAALKDAQQRLNWRPLVEYLSLSITGTVDELKDTRDAFRKLQIVWRRRREFRRNAAALRALDILPHYPVVTIRRLAELLDVTFRAATSSVEQLVEAGILTERTGYKRNRVFVAAEVLEIVNRPFGEEPILPAQ